MNDYDRLAMWLKRSMPEDYDKYDLHAKYDPELSYAENKKAVEDDISALYGLEDYDPANELKEKRAQARIEEKQARKAIKDKSFKRLCLRPITSQIIKYEINSFDIETYSEKNLFLLGGYYSTKYHAFTDKEDMIRFLEINNNQKNILLAATNLQFDFNGLYFGTDDFFLYDIIMRGGSYILCKKEDIKYIDTINISPFSVEKLGQMLNIPKMNHPQFLGKMPKNDNEWRYLKDYNSKDCLITKRFLEYFQDAINTLGGQFKHTIASCSMNLYQREYLKEPIWHEYFDCKDFVFESYYGGRTEAFKRGKIEDYFVYDFNSLYPSCMLNAYPKPESARIITDFENINKYIKNYEGVTEVRIAINTIQFNELII